MGVLIADTGHELVLGNVQHAGSFGFPVLYHVVRGLSPDALMRGDPSLTNPIRDGALALQALGVSAVVGACGSFANYQMEVAAALDIPLFLSILLEVPLLLRALAPSRKLGIVFARTSSFTDRIRENCGIVEHNRLVALGMDASPAFLPVLRAAGSIDSTALRHATLDVVRSGLRAEPRIGAWLLQCSDLPPYAAAIREATGLAVFDMIGMIRRIHEAIATAGFTE